MFDHAIEFVLRHEGGYVNDPDDPGGETNFGISKRAHPDVDIANLTEDEARKIYRREYWDKSVHASMPDPLKFLVFDSAVNQGIKRAHVLMQRALRVSDDGIVGPETISALERSTSDDEGTQELCARFTFERAMAYTRTRNFDKFGRGWMRRTCEALAAAIHTWRQ